MNVTCCICRTPASSRSVSVRGGKLMTLWRCQPCNFEFFPHDPTEGLINDKLDQTRLQAAGLDIPTVDRDFANGLRQSAPYLAEYIDESDRDRNILEIGCSWGYFLKLVQEAGARPYGVELNAVRTDYVNRTLAIPCDSSLEACERRGLKFRKIFMFYVLEYVPQPVDYLRRLVNLLEEDGKLIVITPSLVDPLKDLWRNAAFTNFFYDEHAINYFSPLATKRLVERAGVRESAVDTRQGYSFVNHVSWFLTGAPRTTGVVGGDNFVRDIVAQLRSTADANEKTSAYDLNTPAAHLAELIQTFDAAYKRYLESQELGNQIRLTVCK